MESGDRETAVKIKKEKTDEITKAVLKDYITDFKPKYQEKYLSKFQQFPLGLRDLTKQLHEKLSSSVKDKSAKGRNNFAKSIYDFMNHYKNEDGKAQKYARRLLSKTKSINETSLSKLIIDMGKTVRYRSF